MIVRPNGPTRLLITQPDHAALAGRIMRHWAADGLLDEPRRASILLAIDEHDNGWRDVDASPIVDAATGRVLDFVEAPGAIRRRIWPAAVEHLKRTPYAAAMVAQHALHIYRRHAHDREWQNFFAELAAKRDEHRQRASVPFDELQREYFFLRIGDLASLTFCNAWTSVQTDDPWTAGAAPPRGDTAPAYTIRHEDGHLVIAPDPFAGRQVQLEVRAREMPDKTFSSPAEARAAFEASPIVVLRGTASGRPT